MNTLIILHGWQSQKEKWQQIKDGLQMEGLNVLVPDIPGFKKETELLNPWILDDYVKWLEEFLDSKHIDNDFFLLGHSFGGRISIKFAKKHPKKIKGLILVASAGIKNNSLTKKILLFGALLVRKLRIEDAPFLKGAKAFLRKFFYTFILRKTDYLNTSGALQETIKNVLEEDLTPLLKDIKNSTLLIWGDKDKLTPLFHGKKMHFEIKNSKLKILRGVGHTPYLECPKLLIKIIKEYVISL